mmetsp:Transcript_18013/g.42398  ORF Transcript_18013/g.42398 Transcript_18013/m.42398 type:complete len:210 (+) Transcript_18013:1226-1855(+)
MPCALVFQHRAVFVLCKGHLGKDQLHGSLLGLSSAKDLQAPRALVNLDLCPRVPLENLDCLTFATEDPSNLLWKNLKDVWCIISAFTILGGSCILQHVAFIFPAEGRELQQQVEGCLLLTARPHYVHIAFLRGHVHFILALDLELRARPCFDVAHSAAASPDDLCAIGVSDPHTDLGLLFGGLLRLLLPALAQRYSVDASDTTAGWRRP